MALSVHVSIGYTPFPLAFGKQHLMWERMVNLVDMALYMARSYGRNRAYRVRGFAMISWVAWMRSNRTWYSSGAPARSGCRP